MKEKQKCPKCGSECTFPQWSSFADIYEPEAIHDDPRAGLRQPTGYLICGECHNIFPPNKKH
jgi:RNA polymerase subunit RPABC4/transcription elongation factor Spt4